MFRRAARGDGPPTAIAATAKARALALARGIDLARVPASGPTIREADVARVPDPYRPDVPNAKMT